MTPKLPSNYLMRSRPWPWPYARPVQNEDSYNYYSFLVLRCHSLFFPLFALRTANCRELGYNVVEGCARIGSSS